MKKINATRDEIIKMLESGEIVFAAKSEDDFLLGRGVILYDNNPAYALSHRVRESSLIDYGRGRTNWYVDYAKPFEFKLGDICEFGGVEGKIKEVRDVTQYKYPVLWKSSCEKPGNSFTLDGRLYSWHTKPLLNFIRCSKKKVKKTIEVVTWVEVDESGKVIGVSTSKECKTQLGRKIIKSIATTEIEVEEE